MSFDYTAAVAAAARMIARYGAAMAMVHTATNGATTATAPVGVIEGRVRHTLENSGAQVGDYIVLLDGSASPAETDTLTIGGERHVIVQVEPIKPGGTVVVWRVWARARG